MREWIEIEKFLPKRMALGFDLDYQFCMVINGQLKIYNEKLGWVDQDPINPVTHWMPLPEPPKDLNNTEK